MKKSFMLFAIITFLFCSSCSFFADSTPPSQVSGIIFLMDKYSATVKWTEPSDMDYKDLILSYSDGADTTELIIPIGTAEKEISGLSAGIEYDFSFVTRDIDGNESPAVEKSVKTVKEFIGTWKGTNIDIGFGQFRDVEVILTENGQYIVNLYTASGGTVLQENSAKGTFDYDSIKENTDAVAVQTHVYNGSTWVESMDTRHMSYVLSNTITLLFSYDYDHPHDSYDIVGTLNEQ